MSNHTAKTLTSSLAVAALTLSLATTAAPAHAEPVPDQERFSFDYGRVPYQISDDSTVFVGVFPLLTRAWNDPPTGTVVTFVATSCGRTLREATVTTTVERPLAETRLYLSPSGMESDAHTANSVNRLVGPEIQVSATVTHPGYDAYAPAPVTIDVKARIPKIPSCAQIDDSLNDTPTSTGSLVRTWSKKKALPVVGKKAVAGRKAKITATKIRRGADAKVAYTWRVGGKVVDRDRVIKFASKHIGKPVKVVVAVKQPGSKSVKKTLRYGRVRKAA
jgi:hypothetical protein